ncbi:serine hydrolase domain-containing protein [Niabella insulamsoli]|uniref:serine hydrolase domain-containing protein n=1 Tax=Niabella insulamsoli TaxID=3144874 RepID=UPI0031FC0BB0
MKSVFLSIALFACSFVKAQTEWQAIEKFIQSAGDSLISHHKIPGLAVGLVYKGTTHFYDFGYADPETKKRFTKTTIFEAGSITKTFTAFIVESVLREQRVADTTSVERFLPDSVRTNALLHQITFKNLLNHSSGLPRLPANLQLGPDPYKNYTTDSLFRYLMHAKPKPAGHYEYSNLGAGLAGVLAERMTGKSFDQLLRHYIYEPFRMEDAAANKRYPVSQGYQLGKVDFWTFDALFPAGGLRANAQQMLRYLSVMAQPETGDQNAIIEHLLQPTLLINEKVQVGLGWHLLRAHKNAPVIYWHNGGTFGFSTFAAFLKGRQKAVIVVVNQYSQNALADQLGIAIMRKISETKGDDE